MAVLKKFGVFRSHDSVEAIGYFYELVDPSNSTVQEAVNEYKAALKDSGVFTVLDIEESIHKDFARRVMRAMRSLVASGMARAYWIGGREGCKQDRLPTRIRCYELLNKSPQTIATHSATVLDVDCKSATQAHEYGIEKPDGHGEWDRAFLF